MTALVLVFLSWFTWNAQAGWRGWNGFDLDQPVEGCHFLWTERSSWRPIERSNTVLCWRESAVEQP